MKSILRFILLLVVLALAVVGLTGCRSQYEFPEKLTFDDVKKMESTEPDRALAGYAALRSNFDGKDEEKAAEALLDSARFASDPTRFYPESKNVVWVETNSHDYKAAPPQDANVSRTATKEDLDRKHEDGENAALQALKELQQQYPKTAAAREAAAPTYGPDHNKPMLQALEVRLDARNSHKFSYKLMDLMVAATGRIPWFSYWFALAVIAVGIKFLTLPLMLKTYKSQREMQKLQPLLKELEEKYKGKPAELNEKKMQFFKEHGVNPFASCLPMLIQLPIMWWIYYAIRMYEHHFSAGQFLWIGSALSHRYPEFLATNLAQFDMVLLVLYTASMYLTMKLNPVADPQQAQMQKQTSVMMTVMMFWMFMKYRWSAAFIFYWLVLNIFSAWQQYTYIYKPRKAEQSAGGAVALPSSSPPAAESTDGQTARSNGASGALSTARPVTPIPGGAGMRPRPRKKPRR